eukprot:TRINITY_DN66180_c2_g2_i10.p1 TRINITY_DN66180_c2_g2~~TRINITY_DN66180_c2_g2_i10.p1  ORF type:complete len:164 (+),score=27.02 TRINITY_DN66180_c2_g2_i10:67-558(+)
MNKTFVLLLIISAWGTAVANQEEKKITDSTATQQHTEQPHHAVAQEEAMIQQNLIEDLQQDIENLLQENARLSAQLSNCQTVMDKIVNDLAQKQDTVNDATPEIQGEKKSKYEECMGVCAARKKICKMARYLFCDDSYDRCKKNCNIHKGDDPAEPGETEPAT